MLRWFGDDGVACDEGGDDCPVRHEEREVPRGDGGADAVTVVVDGGFDAFTLEDFWLDGFGDFVVLPVHAGGAAVDFADAFGGWFALFEGEEFAEFFGAVGDDLAGGLEDVGTLLGGHCLPGRECGVCLGDDAVNLRYWCDGDGADDFAGGGVVGVENCCVCGGFGGHGGL